LKDKNGKKTNLSKSVDDFLDSDVVDKNSLVGINGTKFVLVGQGLTADYAYPIFDYSRPIPDFKTQMILYVGPSGVDRFKNINKGLVATKYITGNLNNSSNSRRVLNVINKIGNEYVSDNKDNSLAFLADDTSKVSLLASYRVYYVKNLISQINIFSYVVMGMIGLLSLMVSLFIINKFISDRSVSFGILKSNGFESYKIASAISIFIFL
jgi:putative ABC transport system permease protein